MSRLKPFVAPIAVAALTLTGLSSCQDTAFREQIEGKLTASSRDALDAADLDDADVSFVGRDATVEAGTPAVAATAGAVVRDVTGVRMVTAVGPDGEVDLDAVAAAGDDTVEDGAVGEADPGTAETDTATEPATADGEADGSEAESGTDATEPDDAASAETSDEPQDDDESDDGAEGDGAEDDEADEPTTQEKKKAQDDLVEIPNITFVTDSARLTPSGAKVVRQAAEVLDEHPEVRVRIEGHTDSRGDADHNLDLSKRRAATVRDRLVELGVERDRLSTKGFGESDPLVTPRTFADLEKNRRVEFVVLD